MGVKRELFNYQESAAKIIRIVAKVAQIKAVGSGSQCEKIMMTFSDES